MASSSDEVYRIKDNEGAPDPPAPWPPEGAALGIIVLTVSFSFLVVWSGLALISWQMLNTRMYNDNRTMVLNGEDKTMVQTDDRKFQSADYHNDDYDGGSFNWPMFPGKNINLNLLAATYDLHGVKP